MLITGALMATLIGTAGPFAGAAASSPPPAVSGASATITMKDGLTAAGVAVKPFQAQLTIAGISFPTREGGNQALPGNVFVHISVRVKNLASATRVIPFNGGNFRTMAIGVSHAVPGDGADDPVCTPPALDGLATDQQVSIQVAAQWCVVAGTTESVVVGARKTKSMTFSGEVVSRADALAENFALIYSPSDAADPTILSVGPGGAATTIPS